MKTIKLRKSKFLALLLSVSVLFLSCGVAGCHSKSSGPLRVLVDLAPGQPTTYDAQWEDAARPLLTSVKIKGGPEDVELEVIPASGAERKSALTRIRTEIMAGGGPDVFIVRSGGGYDDSAGGPGNLSLFLTPEKSMELGLFYPLDNFIDDSQFMEWDKLTPAIMEAGRSEEYGQVLLPIAYQLPVTVFKAENVTDRPSASRTFKDMLADNTGVLPLAAVNRAGGYSTVGNLIGTLADYKNQELLFTEEELLDIVQDAVTTVSREEQSDDPDNAQMLMRVCFDQANQIQQEYSEQNSNSFGSGGYLTDIYAGDQDKAVGRTDRELTFIPQYSSQGGISVAITTFAAVNANTKRPEDAFFVLDYLLSGEAQQTQPLYLELMKNQNQMLTYDPLFSEECPVSSWWMNKANCQNLAAIKECFTQVRFWGSFDFDLELLFNQCESAVLRNSGSSVEDLVHETYRVMKLEIGE